MKNSGRLQEQYTLSIGCLLHAKTSGNLITTRWQYHSLSAPGFVRPPTGDTSIKVECPRCKRVLAVTIESLKKAQAKRRAYFVIGAALLTSLLVWVPMLFSVGGQTVDEKHSQSTVFSVGTLFFLVAFSFIVGLALLLSGRVYRGVKRIRGIRPDGALSVDLRGHKLG